MRPTVLVGRAARPLRPAVRRCAARASLAGRGHGLPAARPSRIRRGPAANQATAQAVVARSSRPRPAELAR